MPTEYQIHGQTQYPWDEPASFLKNLRLATVPKPTSIPARHALIHIRAAALNSRDNRVLAHDPVYPGPHVQDIVPCADGAGEVESVGEGSAWKIGDRVIINPNSMFGWEYGSQEPLPGYVESQGKGAVDVQGTMREYAVLVSFIRHFWRIGVIC
jgi:NADPH:quinone reductase-like Zn-dependent oxidoreductase